MIKLNDLFSVLNTQEIIIITDTTGKILIDGHSDCIAEMFVNWHFVDWLEDNREREVNDITVVKQDLSLSETTLMIQII